MNVVNYGTDPYGVEESQIASRMKLAQLIQQQSLDNAPVYSPAAAIAKALMGGLAGYEQGQAEKSQRDLATRKETGRKAEIDAIFRQVGGDAQPSAFPTKDDNGNPMPGMPQGAQPTGRMALARMLAMSDNPAMSSAGLQLAMKGEEPPIIKESNGNLFVLDSRGNLKNKYSGGPELSKIDPKDYTPESFALFQKTNDPTQLRRFDKPPEAVQTFQAALDAAGIDKNSDAGRALYRQFATRQATHAPATNVTVNTGKKFGETLAEDVAKQVSQSADAARGAVGTLQTAKQINDAIATGKVMAGPGTSGVLWLQQVLGAPSTEDGRVQTRNVIQGLSQMTLNSRQSLKGQGQISDFEGKLLAKAASGDIDSLTIPEINAIVKTSTRLANGVISQHQANLANMKKDPNLQQLVPYFDVTTAPSGSNPQIEDLLKKYGG